MFDNWPKIVVTNQEWFDPVEDYHFNLFDTGTLDPLSGGDYTVSLTAIEASIVDAILASIDLRSFVVYRRIGSIYRLYYDYEAITAAIERVQAKLIEAIVDEL